MKFTDRQINYILVGALFALSIVLAASSSSQSPFQQLRLFVALA